jgi:D-alanyl-D-alanine carboxypeptidase
METATLVSRVKEACSCSLLLILLISSPSTRSQTSAISSNSQLADSMDKVAADVYKPQAPGAAIIVMKDGQVIFRRGYGIANLELNVPIRPEMVFRLASVTKQFTAVAIMLLVEQGKLSLQDDIKKFLPDYPTGERKITIENLLTHTSGVKEYTDKLWPTRMREDLRLERLIDVFKNEPLEFPPGTKQSYSNSNYILLGAVIEKASSTPYRQFVEDNIFKPLAMKHSYYEGIQEVIPDRVAGYVKDSGAYFNAPYFSTNQLYAAGALCSSVDDLALWDAATYSEKLLKRGSWERIFTPYKLADGKMSDFGFGWALSRFEGRTIASHTGGAPGFTAYVLRLPEDRVYVAILSNDWRAPVQPEYVAKRLAALAIGKPITETALRKLDAEMLDQFVGQYQDVDGEVTTVRRDGSRLFAQSGRDPEVELFPAADETFVIKAFEAKVSFAKDGQGKVTGMIFHVGDQTGTLKKIK